MDNLKLFKNTWVRKDMKIDHDMVNDCRRNYKCIELTRESKVLDLGANIGGFASMCKEANVKYYVGYEPNIENYKVLSRNINSVPTTYIKTQSVANMTHNFWVVNAAVSADHAENLTFYIRPSKSSAASSTLVPKKINKGLTQIIVENRHIDETMATLQPDILKMDIEGAEKQIIEYWKGIVPDCVKQFALEIHSADYINFFESHYHPMFLDQGFELKYSAPADGFDNKGSTWSHFGVTKNSCLFGYDLYYARP